MQTQRALIGAQTSGALTAPTRGVPRGGVSVQPSPIAASLGLPAAISTAVCAVAFVVANVSVATPRWTGMADYVASFNPAQMLWLLPCLVLAPSFVVLMACVHAAASDERRLLAQIAVALATAYAALATANYFIQLTVVLPSVSTHDGTDLALLAMANPHGLFLALEGLSYLFMQAGMVLVAFVFVGDGLQRSIRWGFLLAGIGCWPLAVLLVVALPGLDSLLGGLGVVSVGTDLWALFTAAAGIQLAIWFARVDRSRTGCQTSAS